MQRAYLTPAPARRCRQAYGAHGVRRLNEIRPCSPPQTGGERHDEIGESLFELWRKIRSCLLPPLGSALLPQSLQGQLPCENGERLCMHEKVVWLPTSPRGCPVLKPIRAIIALSSEKTSRRAEESLPSVGVQRRHGRSIVSGGWSKLLSTSGSSGSSSALSQTPPPRRTACERSRTPGSEEAAC